MLIPRNRGAIGPNPVFEFDRETIDLTKDLNRKLSSQDLNKLIQSFKISVNSDSPCYDSLNFNPPKPRDASANVATQTVCFSPSEVLKRSIPLNQIYHKLTALFVHEVSHLIGYQEKEAEILQAALEKMMRGYSKEEMVKYKTRVFFYFDYDTPDLMEMIGDDLNQKKSLNQVCFKIGQLDQIALSDIGNIQGSFSMFGFSVFNLESFQIVDGIRDPIDAMYEICTQPPSQNSFQQIRSELNTLSQLYRRLSMEIKKAPFPIQ